MSTIFCFDTTENKYSLYRAEDCMKKFCSSIRGHATNVVSSGWKKMLALTKKELKLCQDATTSYICGKISLEKIKIIKKLETIVISQVNTEMQYILHEV